MRFLSGLFIGLSLMFAIPAAHAQSGINKTAAYISDMKHYPNPFDNSFTLEYNLVKDMQVTLLIFDQSGKQVKIWFEGHQFAGKQSLTWDGNDASGINMTSGIYSYVMLCEGVVVAKDRVIKL